MESIEESMELGGNISLSGFKDIPKAELVVVKKIVGSYARKFSDHLEGYEALSLHMKLVHHTAGSEKYEIQAKLVHKGKVENADMTDRNIFVTVDSVLKKLESLAF